jgi:hypothetical protein
LALGLTTGRGPVTTTVGCGAVKPVGAGEAWWLGSAPGGVNPVEPVAPELAMGTGGVNTAWGARMIKSETESRRKGQ